MATMTFVIVQFDAAEAMATITVFHYTPTNTLRQWRQFTPFVPRHQVAVTTKAMVSFKKLLENAEISAN